MNHVYRDFQDDVMIGTKGEELILSKFKTVIEPIINRVIYNPLNKESVQLQRIGIDGYISARESGFDVKCRDYKYYRFKDILLETVSIIEENKPGWVYKTNIVVYMWWNKKKTKFVDGYILYLNKIRRWFIGLEELFDKKRAHSKNNGYYWSTESRIVPISTFQLGDILQVQRDIFRDDEQTIIDNWFDFK